MGFRDGGGDGVPTSDISALGPDNVNWSSTSSSSCFLRLNQQNAKSNPAITATPATDPTTAPAMTPPEVPLSLFEFEASDDEAEGIDEAVRDASSACDDVFEVDVDGGDEVVDGDDCDDGDSITVL